MFRRVRNGLIGIVSTAFIADATPAALVAHTPNRDEYGPVIDSYLHGTTNYSWTHFDGVDVLFGGGAENFLPAGSYKGQNYYDLFAKRGYNVVHNNTELQKIDNTKRALGIFTQSNMVCLVVTQREACMYSCPRSGQVARPQGVPSEPPWSQELAD
jgi:alkaline phosphatase